MKSRTTVGLSVAPDRITVVPLRGGGMNHGVAGTEVSDLSAASIARALHRLGEELGADSITAHVCLLPPLVELKTLRMPRVGRRKLAEMLEARARRYFVGAAELSVVAVAPTDSTRQSPVRVAATCASQALIEDLLTAADEAGWTIASLVSGYDAVAAGWSRMEGKAPGAFVAPLVYDDTTESLHVVDGRACCVRRHGAPKDRLPGPSEPACGATDVPGIDAADDSEGSPLHALAARHAANARGPELMPSALRIARIASGRRLGFSLLAAAAVMVVVAAWAEYTGVRRELSLVQEARSAVSPRVETVLAKREQLATLGRGLSLLSSLETTAPDWIGVVGDLAEHLPADASITWMHGLADSLHIEGTARDASSVLESLRQSRILTRVRAEAPFERKTTERGEVERFRLAAEIAPRAGQP